MIANRRKWIFATCSLLVLTSLIVAAVSMVAGKTNDAHAASAFPAHYFAPYAEIGEGDTMQTVEQTTGQKYFTLAFAISNGSSCQASYPQPTGDIAFIRSVGGDVIQSFGGAAGEELAQTCTSASSLQAQYQSVINTLGLTHLDFDVEGGEEGDATTYTRRDTALAALQQANPGLTISFTLPAAPTGLESSSIGLLNDAVAKGVNFNMVNLMTMDFGNTSVDEATNTISSANGFFNQLKQIFPTKTTSQLWGMIGITDLIGQNDDTEIFTASDGSRVLSFANTNQIGELAFWAVSRDNGSCPGSTTDSDTCDGLSQAPYAFTNSWESFTNGVSITPTPTPTSGTGSVPVAGQAYNVISKNSGKALDVTNQSTADGGGIQQWSLVVGQANQQWTFASTGTGSYYIVNVNSGKVLDDTGWSTTAGTPVQQWSEVSGQANQQWSLVSAGSGYYYIQNNFSGDVLDVTSQSTANGAIIQQWTEVSGQANQEWSLQVA